MPDPGVTLRRLEIADHRWKAAIADSALAPPDAGFADRIRAIAAAAESEAVVLYEAAASNRFEWRPLPKRNPALSYELRPGSNRPGPTDLWDEFDAAVDAVGEAQAGTDFATVADAFRALGEIAERVADAVDEERGVGGNARQRGAG